ncbi:SDR family oxidoreductase [Nocardia terpenica]|uniref:SDR family oxidoreductase n=1 Tax=Nocardia terpenica TaxID=455432 RepID=UPI0018955AF2|nr:SDR family oxidoreductase [Nocardia terpenica]MBF6061598.1 SDR family oxidoreductase [Nocardia terpenica]MBF6107607.1 SDR family oxidoreductase [Nocardia terpenica]MBF6110018.1 SDR family oxidoreductase [Nocardia terpenica]MBF6122470.1 SDR family oxidoreductase [Nocardia terpenica]MBF6151354.1 SDR family oxidoreductase [Nocardia terpenica]
MAYLVTGATGWIGRYLIPELLKRSGEVCVLVRPGADSAYRFDRCAGDWAGGDRVRPVRGDLSRDGLDLDPEWIAAHRGSIEHVIHLAAGYDADGTGEGTRRVVEVAERLEAGVLHHVSTVEVAGAAAGPFTEDMFDIGQVLLTPRQRAAFAAERVIRERCGVPWRIYRPSIVIGHSRTGEIDRIGGPYHFFRLLRMAAQLPRILPIVVPKLGETNMVPVDFVTRALDHIAHLPAPAGTTYHLVDPRRQTVAEVLNLFADEAGAPHLVEVMPKQTLDMLRGLPGVGWVLPRLGVPLDVLEHSEFGCWFDRRNTTAALAGTDIRVPPLAAYAPIVWKYWIENWV